MKKISYVIPCYRSEDSIYNVVNDIMEFIERKNDFIHEIILVNDCSPDNVWETIADLCKKHNCIKGISLAKNFGQHSALMAGYNASTGDYVVTLDDDGQTPVDQIDILLSKIQEGYDVVYGKYEERKDSFFRKIGTAANNFMLETLLGKPKNLHLTSFFICKSYVVKEICKYTNAFPYIWGLVLRTTKNITNVTIKHSERQEGESGYTLSKLLALWMNGFTAFSVKPLRICSMLGMLFSCIGVVGILYTIINKIIHPDLVAGYSSLMTVILFMGGIMMISLGLIGEYVGRIYLCINTMPQYVVKESINLEEDK